MSHRIVFTPSGLDGTVESGTTVLDAARKLGADIDSVCGGRGICGRCQITPSFGSFSKWGIDAVESSLTELSEGEINYKGKRALVEGNRLGCMAKLCGDMVIDVPAMSQVHRQIVRKDLDLGVIVVDPTFSLYYVAVAPSELGDDVTASQIIRDAIAQQHNIARPTISITALSQVNRAIDKGDGGATIAIKRSEIDGVAGNIVAAWPGFVETIFGIAIDIGSTTVAGHLIDLTTGEVMSSSGVMNPQIRFGEDLMSRVSYVMMNKGGEKELTTVIRNAIDELVHELAEKASITSDKILEVVMVGNPIMHHILLGIDPTPLGAAPFVLATSEAT